MGWLLRGVKRRSLGDSGKGKGKGTGTFRIEVDTLAFAQFVLSLRR